MTCRGLSVALSSLCFVLALASCSSCSPASPLVPPKYAQYTDFITPLAAGSVGVFKPTDKGMKVVGAGSVIRCEAGSPIRVISAAHVSNAIEEDGKVIFIGNNSTKRFELVSVFKKMEKYDLVLLEGMSNLTQSCPTVEVAHEFPKLGSYLWVIGYPLGVERNVSHGILSAAYFTQGPPSIYVYRIDAPVAPGNSGGGVFNEQGKLIGVLSYTQMMSVGGLAGELGGRYAVAGAGHAISLPHILMLLEGT